MAVSRFQRGSSVYTCEYCGKQTRETGDSESMVNLCADCYYTAGVENEHQDFRHATDDMGPQSDCELCAEEHAQAREY